MKKVRKRKMFIVLSVLFVIFGTLIIWFNIPYSPVKNQFQNDITALMAKNQLPVDDEIFTEKDFSYLPTAIQKYIENCGYIGTQKMVGHIPRGVVLTITLCSSITSAVRSS